MIAIEESIVHIYSALYSRVYGNKDYKFTFNEKSLDAINSFLVMLNKQYNLETLGENTLINYFIFHLIRLDGQEIKRYSTKDSSGNVLVKGRFQIYDFIGKKAFDYWKKRNTKFDYLLRDNFVLKKYKISISDLYLQQYEILQIESEINYTEELEKKRFFNTPKGFNHCIDTTTLYHPLSENCEKCSFKNDCIEVLKLNHLNIYKSRFYDEAKSKSTT